MRFEDETADAGENAYEEEEEAEEEEKEEDFAGSGR